MIQSTEQLAETVGVNSACQVLEVPRSSLYRARQSKANPQPAVEPPTSPRALSQDEKAEVRQMLNSQRFQDSPPREVYASLLDEGQYLCSWRTMYRILEANAEVRERRDQCYSHKYP